MRTLFYDDLDLEPRLAAIPRSLFLAGPTARGVGRTPWRAEALALLEARGFDGTTVLPEFRDGLFEERAPAVFGGGSSPVPHMRPASHAVLQWETTGIEGTTVVLFWMPFTIGDSSDPGFTTRAEVSRELARQPSRIVLGMPPGALSSSHIRYHAARAGVPIAETLAATVDAALARLG